MNLSWADVAGEEGFKVERKLASSSTWSQIGTTGANVVSYADTNSGLTAGTSYNYRVRAYTTAGNSGYSNTVTASTPLPTLSARDVVLYASEATVRVGAWTPVADATAAGGSRLNNPNAGAAVVSAAQANPSNYFEMDFTAPAGVGFRIWLRGKAYNDSGYSDSVYVQFSDSLSSPSGSAIYRIGGTSGTTVNLAEASRSDNPGLGLAGQRLRHGSSRPAGLLRHLRHAQAPRAGARRRLFYRPDRVVTRHVSDGGAWCQQARLDQTSEAERRWLDSAARRGTAIMADTYVRGGSYSFDQLRHRVGAGCKEDYRRTVRTRSFLEARHQFCGGHRHGAATTFGASVRHSRGYSQDRTSCGGRSECGERDPDLE